MTLCYQTLVSVWQVVALMSPYLLLGFAAAGVLSVALSPDWVRRQMGRPGLWQVTKAALLGVPLPLCSCSVLPVAFSLRRHGASKGATVSFLAATPQTGADNILATYAVLGPIFAVFSVVAAFLSGILAGTLVDLSTRHEPAEPAKDAEETCDCCGHRPWWQRILRHALIVSPREIARPLLLGVVVTGLITTLVPAGFFQGRLPPGWGAYAMTLLIGIPIYVCSISSIPLAASLIYMGTSPGAAIVFLIVGPATNAAAILTLWTRIGRRGTVCYLLALIVTAVACGTSIDLLFPGTAAGVPPLTEACAEHAASWWRTVTAIVFLVLLAPGLIGNRSLLHDS